MSKLGAFFRYIFFCLFFSLGAGAMTLSFMAPELLANLKSIEYLNKTEYNNEKLKEMIDIYQRKIDMIENDPQALERLKRKTFGIEPSDDSTVFPKATLEELELADAALKTEINKPADNNKLAIYLERSAEPIAKKGLFLAGAALILISFVSFGTIKEPEIENK